MTQCTAWPGCVLEAGHAEPIHDIAGGIRGVGKKYDDGKARWDLLPSGLAAIVDVLSYGAKKYGDNNWRIVEPKRRYLAATFRHLWAYLHGEINDPESGLPHLAHAGCCILFLLSIVDANA